MIDWYTYCWYFEFLIYYLSFHMQMLIQFGISTNRFCSWHPAIPCIRFVILAFKLSVDQSFVEYAVGVNRPIERDQMDWNPVIGEVKRRVCFFNPLVRKCVTFKLSCWKQCTYHFLSVTFRNKAISQHYIAIITKKLTFKQID